MLMFGTEGSAKSWDRLILYSCDIKQILRMSSIFTHCILGLCIRLALIAYGEVHDSLSVVQYTDTDYRVFTDAARHMLSGSSPYDRHTYRYTPLLAAILTPNLFLHPAWGKLLFSVVDICVALLIRCLVVAKGSSPRLTTWCVMAWVYNPLAIIIATRGNADSISALLVLVTLLLLEKQYFFLAGVMHGLAIHVRLYPIAFSLAMYLSVHKHRPTSLIKWAAYSTCGSAVKQLLSDLRPTWNHVKLVLSCAVTFGSLTSVCYAAYGYPFLYESLLYHLVRRDIRHNFSVYFYLLYLGSDHPVGLAQRILTFAPQLVLLLSLSWSYGCRRDLPFCFLSQAIVMVTYNPVLTSQYFVWFLSLVPPCVPWLSLSCRQAVALSSLWLAAQLAWLLPAYWLEFRGQDTFMYVWLQGIALFCANVAVLTRFIRAYKPLESDKLK